MKIFIFFVVILSSSWSNNGEISASDNDDTTNTTITIRTEPTIYCGFTLFNESDNRDPNSIICVIRRDTATTFVLAETNLGRVIIEKDGVNYTIRDYPRPITSLTLSIVTNLTITTKALKTLMPNLTSLIVLNWGYHRFSTYVSIETNLLEELRQLRHFSMGTSLAVTNESLQTILSTGSSLEKLSLDVGNFPVLPRGVFGGLKKLEILELRQHSDNYTRTRMESGAFEGLRNLRELEIGHVEKLSPGLFKDLGKLENLRLESSHSQAPSLKKLASDTFQGLGSLLELVVFANQITSIEPGAFNGLKNLHKLHLQDLTVDHFADGVWNGIGKNISTLFLMNFNKTTHLNSRSFRRGLESLQNLEVVHFYQLKSIEGGTFDHLTDLRQLSMSYDFKLRYLPDGLFDKLIKLEKADFTRTCIDGLSRANFTSPNLQSFELGECK